MWLVLVCPAAGLVGCTSSALAPVASIAGPQQSRDPSPPMAAERHVVERGETLYAIAWRYGIDYRQLARWNRILEPFTIFPGEVLLVRDPGDVGTDTATGQAARRSPAPAASRKAAKPDEHSAVARARAPSNRAKAAPPAPRVAPRARPAPSPGGTAKVLHWRWPARGKVVGKFGRSGRKGIDIAGQPGAAVGAAAAGKVVYSGSGLIGYGRLIILKHDARYLSAYAHNQEILVREGDVVAVGQKIATMGRSGADRIKLHFEIRRDGKPVNPLRFLSR